jgi:transcriptional regulator with XRE-family HTH domain
MPLGAKTEIVAAADVEKAVGARISQLRKARRMTQTELGEALATYGAESLAQPLIYRVESGKRPLRVNELAAFAAALGVTMVDLLPGGPSDQPDRQAALQATMEAAQTLARADGDAQDAQRRVDEAQRQLDQATQELRAATRRRTDAAVAYELASMRWNAGGGR